MRAAPPLAVVDGAPPAPAAASMVDVEELRVEFPAVGGSFAALRGIELAVPPGEILTIVGESGCGKSLFLRSLVRLLPPTSRMTGRIRVAGTDVATLERDGLRRLRGETAGMVFQDPLATLDPLAPIGRQIEDAIRAHHPMDRAAARRRALELLDQVHLPDAASRIQALPHELSGGQRQRVGIALALAAGPTLLLADEPTTSLDVSVQARILALLHEIRSSLSMTIVLVTHDIGVVADMADRVAVMYAGRIVETGPATQVLRAPRHPYARALIRAHRGIRRRQSPLPFIPGAPPRLSPDVAGCAFAPRCAERLEPCEAEMPPRRVRQGSLCECWIDR